VKYKVIEIEYPINQKILSYINELFSGFPKEDLFYELNENSLRIYLRKINFITFKKTNIFTFK
jgi:hypothetical protein